MKYFFLCALSVALLASNAHAQTNQISGQLELPTGVAAVGSSAVFQISTDPVDTYAMGEETVETRVSVTLPAFSSIVSYSLPLKDIEAPDEPDATPEVVTRRVKFDCISGCNSLAATTTGFWGGTLGVVSQDQAVEYDVTQSQQVNITLGTADRFSGSVNLPDGISATGSEVFTITATGSQFQNPPTFSQVINVEEGEQSWPFLLGLSPDLTGGGWTFSLECTGCVEGIPEGLYYPSTLGGVPLTQDVNRQFFYVKGRTYRLLKFTLPLITKPEAAKAITPVISLILED